MTPRAPAPLLGAAPRYRARRRRPYATNRRRVRPPCAADRRWSSKSRRGMEYSCGQVDVNRDPLGRGTGGGVGEDERGAAVFEAGAGIRPAVDRIDEGHELEAIGLGIALREEGVIRGDTFDGLGAVGTHSGRSNVADLKKTRAAKGFDALVVAVCAMPRVDDGDQLATNPAQCDDGAVVVAGFSDHRAELLGAAGGDFNDVRHKESGHIEVVDSHIAEYS